MSINKTDSTYKQNHKSLFIIRTFNQDETIKKNSALSKKPRITHTPHTQTYGSFYRVNKGTSKQETLMHRNA